MKNVKNILVNYPKPIEVPWHVWTCFGGSSKKITFAEEQASLGEDFKTLAQLQTAIEWYVKQLGGKVKW